MDRTQRHRRRGGALWLLLLALVSVVAPVWADTYVCPMAKEALEATSACCTKAPVAHQAIPGAPRLEAPCDCPELSWTADPADHVRELRTGSDQTFALSIDPPRAAVLAATKSVAAHAPPRQAAPRSTPPLWRLNQAILC